MSIECKAFKYINNPRPWRKNERILCHGLLKCQTCSRLWNRDVNSSINIRKITQDIIDGKGRPDYLKRGNLKENKPISGVTSTLTNHNPNS